jgi:phage FluMu protein Com
VASQIKSANAKPFLSSVPYQPLVTAAFLMKPNCSICVYLPEETGSIHMDITRCPKCNRRLTATTECAGRTELKCLKCDEVDHTKTDAVKRADKPFVPPKRAA